MNEISPAEFNLSPEVEAMVEEARARLASVAAEVMKIPEDQLPLVTGKHLELVKAFESREDGCC